MDICEIVILLITILLTMIVIMAVVGLIYSNKAIRLCNHMLLIAASESKELDISKGD